MMLAVASISLSTRQVRLNFWRNWVVTARDFDRAATYLAVGMAIPEQVVLWIVNGEDGRGEVGMKLAATAGGLDSPNAAADWWWIGGQAIDLSGVALTDALLNTRLFVAARSVQRTRLYHRRWVNPGWEW
jgi:hypothetical protein